LGWDGYLTSCVSDGSNKKDDDNNDDENAFDHHKLVLCRIKDHSMNYNNYIYKEPCMISNNTNMRWLNEILHGHWEICVNIFRIDATIF